MSLPRGRTLNIHHNLHIWYTGTPLQPPPPPSHTWYPASAPRSVVVVWWALASHRLPPVVVGVGPYIMVALVYHAKTLQNLGFWTIPFGWVGGTNTECGIIYIYVRGCAGVHLDLRVQHEENHSSRSPDIKQTPALYIYQTHLLGLSSAKGTPRSLEPDFDAPAGLGGLHARLASVCKDANSVGQCSPKASRNP